MQFHDLEKYVERNCPGLARLLEEFGDELKADFVKSMAKSYSAGQTLARLDDLVGALPGQVIKDIFMDPEVLSDFIKTISGSRHLFMTLNRRPELAEEIFLDDSGLEERTREQTHRSLRELTKPLTRERDFMNALRDFKEREFLRIGRLDLSFRSGPREVMKQLSNLASASAQMALEFHARRLQARYGAPPGIKEGHGLVILGMGKLAGGELNFSSDVDLIFLCASHEGKTTGPQPIPARRYFEELAQSIARSLSEVTEHGFVFRVDLRLRPEGEKGELVPSAENAIGYYLSWGRTWERAALMKAAVVAGDSILGQAFLKAIEPFVYRRHLDYSTLEDMREMKKRIQSQIKKKPGINIKLGQGGIREIEFFVQALQLINSGKNPQARSPSTVEALRSLAKHDLLDGTTARELEDAYIFFRNVEHKIQINYQLQTHEIPRSLEQQAELAERMGYPADQLHIFMGEIESKRSLVEDLFASLFHYTDEAGLDNISAEAHELCESMENKEKALRLMEEAGFIAPQRSYGILQGFVSPSQRRWLSDRGKAMLEKLTPLFLDEILKTPEPDQTLHSLDRYIDSLKGGSAYLATFLENLPTARYLTQILGQSKFFADMLVKYPQAVDSLISRYYNEPPKEKGALMDDLNLRLATADLYETELDIVREFKHEETLRIGVKHLSGEILATTARWLVTELAEALLESAVNIALREMERKFGHYDFFENLPLVIVGMGKVGGQEMSYLSDLDIIFIFDPPMDQIGALSCREWFTRLASRIISILSAPTSQGAAYEIDTRLRPSGNQGPLVSTLDSFRDYHETESKLWEKQALIRARPLTGPVTVRDEVANIMRECVKDANLDGEGLKEMVRLRRRMESELADEDMMHVDLKTGHGGLVDVEFLVQANILSHMKENPDILRHNTLEALEAQYRAGVIGAESFHALNNGYRFLSDLVDMLRLKEQRSVNRLTLEGPTLKAMSKRMGFGPGGEKDFIQEYYRITRAIRKEYNKVFHVTS
jgi:glutamate-ammonia-ligase adenylyltransferase